MNTEKENEPQKKLPQDPLTADKAAWKRYWQQAIDHENASDEHTRQLIEEGKKIRERARQSDQREV
jgi:hypothetical protein